MSLFKTNKIFLIEDGILHHIIIEFSSPKLVDFDFTLGEEKSLINFDEWPKIESKYINKLLFPKGRVYPIILDNLTDKTMVILRIRPNHFLLNTTLSQDDIHKEVICNSNKNQLLYFFFGFAKQKLIIRPRISEDDIDLINSFKNDLTDNNLRQMILKLLLFSNPPKTDFKKYLFEAADNSIQLKGSSFHIKYKGQNEWTLQDTSANRDIIFIIKNEVNITDERSVLKLWNKVRGINLDEGENIYAYTVASNLKKNHLRVLKNILKQEEKKQLKEDDKFSNFIKDYIKITDKPLVISYKAPDNIKWSFDLPSEFI